MHEDLTSGPVSDTAPPRRRFTVPLLAIVLTAAIAGLILYGMLRGGTGATLDDALKRGERPQAPGATLKLPPLAGSAAPVSLERLRGRIVVLNFWGSWCDPCRAEAPVLEAAQRRLRREHLGTVLGASYNDPPDKALAFARSVGISYPLVTDVGTKLAQTYGTTKLPETFILDRKGRIVAVSRGQISGRFLDRAITMAARS